MKITQHTDGTTSVRMTDLEWSAMKRIMLDVNVSEHHNQEDWTDDADKCLGLELFDALTHANRFITTDKKYMELKAKARIDKASK